MSETGARAATAFNSGNDVFFLLQWGWRLRIALSLAAGLGLVAGLGASYAVTPIYQAQVELVLSMEDANSALRRAGADLGNIASLVGISATGSGAAQADELVAILDSRALGNKFIDAEAMQTQLLNAPHLQSALAGLLGADDHAERRAREAYRRFTQRVRVVEHDRKTGLVQVGMRWPDPQLAAQWANHYVALADDIYRGQQLVRHRARVTSLQKELETARTAEVRVATAKLFEDELKFIMNASTRGDFAFRVIDPAVAPLPSERQSPHRSIYMLVGSLAMLSLVTPVLWYRSRFQRA